MAFRKININAPLFTNVEDEARSSLIAEARYDVMKDSLGATIRRPGFSEHITGLDRFVEGMFYWRNTDLVYFVSNGNFYSLDKYGVTTLISSGVFNLGEHTSWGESPDLTLVTSGEVRKIFVTNGGRIVYHDGTNTQQLTSSNTPVQSSHLILFKTYLMSTELNDSKYDETIIHSDIAAPLTWSGDYFSAENKPDKLNAIHTAWDEIALFGPDSIENVYNDGVTPFTSIPGGLVQSGTLSPWTIKNSENSYFYLDTDRRVIRLTGRQPLPVSGAIDDLLEGDIDYANATGEILSLNKVKLYLLTINDRTLVYDIGKNEWIAEWATWNKSTAKYDKFGKQHFLNIKDWGVSLCCDTDIGTIYKVESDVYQDNGEEMRSSVITGQIDHRTGREKRSNELKLRIKKGQVQRVTLDDPEPLLLVRWRDNGSKVWSNYREIPLGWAGETEFYHSLFQLGSYRSRQYEFMCSDNTPFSLIEAEEDVTLLR